jgi:hypothetical protein
MSSQNRISWNPKSIISDGTEIIEINTKNWDGISQRYELFQNYLDIIFNSDISQKSNLLKKFYNEITITQLNEIKFDVDDLFERVNNSPFTIKEPNGIKIPCLKFGGGKQFYVNKLYLPFLINFSKQINNVIDTKTKQIDTNPK